MDGLVKQLRFGDITFGIPEDLDELHRPWGYYDFLGVDRDASPGEIKKAYRTAAKELHSDKGGNDEAFIILEKVYSVLSDDGGRLGSEHSKRAHYDKVSSLDETFNDYIQHCDVRTMKFSEIMLGRMEAARKNEEVKREFFDENPDLEDMIEKANDENIDVLERIKLKREIEEKVDKLTGQGSEAKKEFEETIRQELYDHAQRFKDEVRTNAKGIVADIFYDTTDALFSSLTIGSYSMHNFIPIFDGDVLRIQAFGVAKLPSFGQVHVKAEKGEIRIKDPHIGGLIHLVEGSVSLDYNGTAYGEVVQVDAPIIAAHGFEKKGNLYIPRSQAHPGWEEKEPHMKIVVKHGQVDLVLSSQYHSPKTAFDNILQEYLGSGLAKKNNPYKELYKIIKDK